MSNKESFAALLGGTAPSRDSKRFRPGDVVSGSVIQIGNDTVFIDIGGQLDARIDRSELVDRKGELQVKLGDTVTATVVNDSAEHGPRLAKSFGRGTVDVSQLQQAKDSGLPVEGKVVSVSKGGLELLLGGVRAFCPASHVELGYAQDLEVYVGQALQFRVVEIKDGGRSIVASRKALLQAEAQSGRDTALSKLAVGEVMEGTVVSVQKFGAFIDLGGIQGLAHISELAHHRVERVEDVLEVGERVQVRVQKVERGEKGQPRIELSMKALSKPEVQPTVQRDQVVDATVVKSLPNGILVETAQGSGLVPARELGIPRGADHRRAFPIGSTLRVVVLNRDPTGRLSFSAAKVGAAEERQNFADYGKGEAVPSALGSFGQILRAKMGLPEPPPAPPVVVKPPSVPAAVQPPAPAIGAAPSVSVVSTLVVNQPKGPPPASRVYVDEVPVSRKQKEGPHKPGSQGGLPMGVVRRRRDP